MAKFGSTLKKAQDGTSLENFLKTSFAERKRLAKELGYADYAGKDLSQQKKLYDLFKNKPQGKPLAPGEGVIKAEPFSVNNLVPNYEKGYLPNVQVKSNKSIFHPPSVEDMGGPGATNTTTTAAPNKGTLGNIAMTALSNLEPFLRPTNANEPLPPDQLYSEYLALATNQLEPVRAQKFQPMLDTPYDISLNDQLNAVDSQSRAAIRAAGQNPAAQSMIMAQALEAKNKVLGEQTRINQANKMGVYGKNRELLNQAQLQNLQILDQQYTRQAQAASNTKAQNQAALSSIAAKTAQQRAANRQLAVMENMYNFRFTPSGRAINANAPQFFNMSGSGASSSAGQLAEGYEDIYNAAQQRIGSRRISKSKNDDNDLYSKNGGKTSKIKARNGSIVKALKNI